MKAVVLNRLGDFDSLVDAEVRDLKVSADEILVKTRAVAVDPIDIKIGNGSRGGRGWGVEWRPGSSRS
ncbi:hypothetical protein [Weissella cibaria]|uniref:hypothetical protein n=1 Tax=Weissella cibaria TaxID=137591 RepID=UPI001E56D3BA|nr:hypothetical protein [Weissella cibaria]